MFRKLAGKLLGFGLATVLLVLTAGTNGGAVIIPNNLLKNGGFEQCSGCTSEAGGIPVNWRVHGAASGGDVSWTTAEAAVGKASVHITDTSFSEIGVQSASVEANPGARYVFEVWTKAGSTATATTPASMAINFFNEAGQRIGGIVRTFALRSTFTPQSTRLVAPVGTETVNVAVYGPAASTGDFYADAASLLIDIPGVQP